MRMRSSAEDKNELSCGDEAQITTCKKRVTYNILLLPISDMRSGERGESNAKIYL